MNRKDFLKSIIGFAGVAIAIPTVLMAKPRPAVSDFIYAKARRSGRESMKFGMPFKDKYYHTAIKRRNFEVEMEPVGEEYYTQGLWPQL